MRFIDASPFHGIHLFTHTHNPAEVRSADFRNAKYSDVASPYPYGGSHFDHDVFPATSFSDHLRCPYAIHSLQGRDKLRLASIETNRGPERGEYRRGIYCHRLG